MHARYAGFCVLVALLGVCASSRAQPSAPQAPRASLVVTRSEGAQDCPDSVALAGQVRTIAGSDFIGVGVSVPAETFIQVAIVHDFDGYKAQINALGRHHGARSLEDLGPGCASLADAIAVTLAIFLDPYANAPAPQPALSVVPLAPAPPAPLPPKPRVVPQILRRRSPWFFDASAGLGIKLLEHSEPLLTGSLGLRLSPRWTLALGGSYVFSDTKHSDTGAGEVRLRLSYGYVVGCGRALGDSDGLRLDWCAAPLVGLLEGEGHYYRTDFSERALWLTLAAGPRIVFPLADSWSWVLDAQGVVPLVQRGFDEISAGARHAVFRTSSVGALMSLGIRGQL